MIDIRPIDVPELRADIREQMGYLKLMGPLLKMLGIKEPAEAKEFVEAFQAMVEEVDLYHVAAPMTELACAASDALEMFTPHRVDMPSKGGLVIFNGEVPKLITCDDGCRAAPLRGAIWFAHAERPEVTILPISEPHDDIAVPGRLVAYPHAIFSAPLEEDLERLGKQESSMQNDDILSLLLTTWLLMQQPLADTSQVELDRAARKRLRRAGREPAPVRVIELRRPKGSSENGEGSRDYQHQWIVRGHWRQQWYPARQVNRPVWIAPHIKGPEGAPMIGGEKVYAWKR